MTRNEFLALQWLTAVITLIVLPISTAGVTKGYQKANAGRMIMFRKFFNEVTKYYWRLFILPFLIVLIVVVSVLVTSIFFSALSASGIDMLICLFPLIVLVIPAILLLVVGVIFTNISLVTDDLSIGEAISNSNETIRANINKIVGMFLAYTIMPLLISLGLSFIYSAAISSGIFIDPSEPFRIVVFILIIILFYLVAAILNAFYQGLWILSYIYLKRGHGASTRKA